MSGSEEDTIEIMRPAEQVEPADEIVAESLDEGELEIAVMTHRGKVRSRNEDQYSVVRRSRRLDVLPSNVTEAI